MADHLSFPTAEALIAQNQALLAAAIEVQVASRHAAATAAALRREARAMRRRTMDIRQLWLRRWRFDLP